MRRIIIAAAIVFVFAFSVEVRASTTPIVPEPVIPEGMVVGCHWAEDLEEMMKSGKSSVAERKIRMKRCFLVPKVEVQLQKALRPLRASDGNLYCLVEVSIKLRNQRTLTFVVAGQIDENQRCGKEAD